MSHATLSVLPLTEADHSNLRALAHARTAPRHHAERAGIVLQLATGWSVREAATRLGLNPQRVRRYARRAAAVGAVRALDDLPRSGRPRQITQAARLWLVGQACAQPKTLGYPHELWTLRLLADHARRVGLRQATPAWPLWYQARSGSFSTSRRFDRTRSDTTWSDVILRSMSAW